MKTVTNFVQSETQPFSDYVRAFLPPFAIVPFTQIKGQEYRCIVKENDTVSEGQIIAVPESNEYGSSGASIHSPVPGKITGIVTCSLPNGKIGMAARIRLTGSFSYLGKRQAPSSWNFFSAEDICTMFAQKGVVNTFCDSTALAAQIADCKLKKGRLLVVRLFDEDPSRMTDRFISQRFTDNVIEGAFIIAKALQAEGIIFAVPQTKKNESSNYKYDILSNFPHQEIHIDTRKYPCGFMQDLIQYAKHELKNEPTGVFKTVSTYSLFIDSETALSAYEAVVLGVPVVERYVHVTGSCLRSAGMFKVRIGTSIKSLAEQCGGFKIQPAKIIINGLITGFAVSSMDTPITKQIKSITFVSSSELNDQHYYNCIRCGKCRMICPEGIYPDLIFRHQTGGKPVGEDLRQTADLCSECCLCNCVCPARLPLSQTIALLKETKHE